METSPATPQIWMIAFGIGMSIFFFFSWDPIAKRLKKFEPDPEKGYKTMLLVCLAVYVLAVLIMILAIVAHMFGIIS
jgi:purine-cytosine permease-like protein